LPDILLLAAVGERNDGGNEGENIRRSRFRINYFVAGVSDPGY
jgi:hypothetical protein